MLIEPFFSLVGKVALVTGASFGFGAGIVRVLAKAGAMVVLLARRDNHAETFQLMKHWYQQEIDIETTYSLDTRLQAFDRSKGASKMDQWFTGLSGYLQSTGMLKEALKLRKYALGQQVRRLTIDMSPREAK